ncbi:MAG: peptide chain release factor N(5)-glutamine methyltransferase [Pseudomonadota bacterium]
MFSQNTLHIVRTEARKILDASAVDSPALCVDVLLCHVFGLKRTDLVLERGMMLGAQVEKLEQFTKLLQRRAQGEPLAYIIGYREFFGRDFLVSKDTLIPRPETELLVECALEEIGRIQKEKTPLNFLDAGTGTGCIAITMLAENGDVQGIALDRSSGALAIAKQNAQAHNVFPRLQCMQGDFTTALIKPNSLDIYLTNPPYISQEEYQGLSPEVRDFEPATALVPGPSGLEHAKAIIAHATVALKKGGIFLMEFGCDQGQAVAELFEPYAQAWAHVEIKKDLAGLDRFVLARRNN